MTQKKINSQKEVAKTEVSRTISPFKDKALLEKEIKDFANKYKTIVVNQSKRISDYFEMCCFNYIVKYYELKGYDIMVQNLQKGMYRYKCSTSGIQSNFSHFEISIELDGTKYIFEVQHNLANQSSHDENIFTTPDISIIVSGAVKTIVGYYDSKKRFSFVENKDICSFCEVKNFTPFPELIFNFVGVLNEIRKDIISNSFVRPSSPHIAPCLMISGKPNKQTSKIKSSLEARYCINIVYDLFYAGTEVFSIKHLNKLRMLST